MNAGNRVLLWIVLKIKHSPTTLTVYIVIITVFS